MRAFVAVVLCALLLATLCAAPALAEQAQPRVVRVGYYASNVFQNGAE